MSPDLAIHWLADTLVYTGLLMLLVLLIRRPVARMFGPGIAYLLWLLPAARLFMPALTQTLKAAPATPAALPADAVAAASTVPLPEEALAATPVDVVTSLLVIWAAGAALFFAVRLAVYLINRRSLLRDAVPIGSVKGIRIVAVPGVCGPFAFGLRSRYIALPEGFARSHSPQERELALAHEIAHHEAGDLWANFVGLLMLSLHWFNPVAWAAWSRFRFDQEAACDARVIGGCDIAQKRLYGSVVARAATGRTLSFASPLGRRKMLKRRLEIIGRRETPRSRALAGKLLLGSGIVATLAGTATVTQAVVAADAPASVQTGDPRSRNSTVITETTGKGGPVYTRTIVRDGHTITINSDRKLSETEIADKVHQSEENRARAESAQVAAERARLQAQAARIDAEAARMQAEGAGHDSALFRLEAEQIRREAEQVQQEALEQNGEAIREARQIQVEAMKKAMNALLAAQKRLRVTARDTKPDMSAPLPPPPPMPAFPAKLPPAPPLPPLPEELPRITVSTGPLAMSAGNCLTLRGGDPVTVRAIVKNGKTERTVTTKTVVTTSCSDRNAGRANLLETALESLLQARSTLIRK